MTSRIAAALLALSIISGCSSDTTPSTQAAVEERLTCQCGCGLTVHTCNHLQCGFAIPVRKDIADSLAKGQTGDEIVHRYIAEYGEKILSSPTWTGFNLLAWYGPYVAIFVSGVIIIFVMLRWRRTTDAEPSLDAPPTPMSEEQRRRLDRELERLDE